MQDKIKKEQLDATVIEETYKYKVLAKQKIIGNKTIQIFLVAENGLIFLETYEDNILREKNYLACI